MLGRYWNGLQVYIGHIEPWIHPLALILLLTNAGLTRGQGGENSGFHPQLRSIAHMSWTERDGAPLQIAALAQTTDGYLWIGSALGLYRFDGIQFASYPVTALDTALPSSDIESLAADQEDGLWIGFRLGGISHLGSDGTVTNYNRVNKRGPGEVQKLMCRSDKSVWALGDGKLIVLQSGRWQNFGTEHGLPNDELYTFYFDKEGSLWTAAKRKVFRLKKSETKFTLYPMDSFAVVDFAETPDGQLWVSDAWHSVHPVGSGTLHATITTKGLARIAIGDADAIWMAQDYRGISHTSVHDPSDVVKESAVSDQTDAILRDRDGNIWVGSSLGLDRFQRSMLQSLSGIRLEYYPALAADPQGGVWVATHEHPLLHVIGGLPVAIGLPVGSSPVASGKGGRVWLVDPVLHDLVQYNHSKVLRVPNPAESDLVVAQSIGLDFDGCPLVDFLTKGLWKFDGVWHHLIDPALGDEDVLAIFRESDRRVWLGLAYGRIVMRDPIGFHELPITRDNDIGNVLAFASLQGRLWAGGTEGVGYFQARAFHKLVLKNGFALRGVSGIVEDKSHNLWFNSQRGIVRIDAGEVQKAIAHSETPLTWDVLDERQGLLGVATQLKPTPSAVAEKDGTLAFATDGHVFFLDPSKASFHHSLPSVAIESVSLNGSAVADREHPLRQIRVNAGLLRSLEIDYIGIDLTSPGRTTYKYMMEGEDAGWQIVGSRHQAFYSHLSPGAYRFRVLAGTDDVHMAELSVPLMLTVTPAFYQTAWFTAICCLLILTVLYLAYAARMQYVTNRLHERLNERSIERTRIARELHDTLLQSIHGLMLRFHFATEALPPNEPARQALLTALSRADDVILEGRQRVQDLREDFPDSADFAAVLATVGAELEMGKWMDFKVRERGERQELNPIVQNELSTIAREALTNTLNHSKATSSEISLSYGRREFTMSCSDNGIGLSQAILSNGKLDGHWGLVGMRERTSNIRGKMQLWSSRDVGTRIEICIPGPIAYRFPKWQAKLWRLLARYGGMCKTFIR